MSDFQQLHDSIDEMRQQARELRDEVERMTKQYGWSDWEPYTVGIIPMRVNGRWYFKGDTIYRKEKMKYLTGSRQYKYGDLFDYLKHIDND